MYIGRNIENIDCIVAVTMQAGGGSLDKFLEISIKIQASLHPVSYYITIYVLDFHCVLILIA